MNKIIFRITLAVCLLVASLLFSGTACAQREELPDPGITPDSPFYFLDNWGKSVSMFFTFGPEAKARKALRYAEERLAEARAMAAKNKLREMTRAANGYDDFMAMVNRKMVGIRHQVVSENISESVALAAAKHLSVLDRIKDQVPEAAEGLAHARKASMNGQEHALLNLAGTKPDRAIDIALDTVEKRLERARVKATENATAEMEDAMDDAARIAATEEEIAAIAQEKGFDITAIEKHLARSTSNRLEVLAEIHAKVPDKARPAIENAMQNSVLKYQRAVEMLKERHALGDIGEEAPALQRIQAQLAERLRAVAAATGNTTVPAGARERGSGLKPEPAGPGASANKTTGLESIKPAENITGLGP